MQGVAMGFAVQIREARQVRHRGQRSISELGEVVDDLAVIRSMHTDIPAHEVATIFMNTGSARLARPSVGSWVLYGLGTENQNMPGYVSCDRAARPPVALQTGSPHFCRAFTRA
jgi:hypothetical protein